MSYRLVQLHFDRPLQVWDGFGFNYVETCQTRDYGRVAQDYGGFGLLTAADRERALDLVFGDDGLQPALLKMFLDPWHQPERPRPGEPPVYDHERTTAWMRLFAREGARRRRARGGELEIVTTLYGPPAWMTRQGFLRGRDLDPACAGLLVDYVVDWVAYLRREEGLRVQAVSLHNEGEDWSRWPDDGGTAGDEGHDYNLFWSPDQVVAMVPRVRAALDARGLKEVRVTPGETTNWKRFQTWGYADALAADPAACAALGLITSHGFYSAGMQRWSADHRSAGTDRLRARRPDLHAWVTSSGWGKVFGMLVWEVEHNLYSAGCNGFIPWAGIQCHGLWAGGDPNPQCALRVGGDGTLTVNKEYHVYRHLCRAGRPGTRVATVSANDSEIVVVAFAGAGAGRDAAVVANVSKDPRRLRIALGDGAPRRFAAARTTQDEDWRELHKIDLPAEMELPAGSVTSFVALT